MGFIVPANNKVTLTAFLTQRGREALVNGTPAEFQPAYFALSDPDTNYLQAAQTNSAGQPNVLPSGFVPDLSGDYSGCIHSLAGGVVQRSFLYGGNAVGLLGTNNQFGSERSQIAFGPSRVGPSRVSVGIRPGQRLTIPVPLYTIGGGVYGGEQVRLSLLPPSQPGGADPQLYPVCTFSNGGIVTWSAATANPAQQTAFLMLDQPVLPPPGRRETTQGGYSYLLNLVATPYRSNVVVPQATGLFQIELFFSLTLGRSGPAGTSGSGGGFFLTLGGGGGFSQTLGGGA